MKKGEGSPAIGFIGKCHMPGFGEMVGVDREVSDSCFETMVHDMCDQRAVFERDKGLWKTVGQRSKASP